MNVSFKKRIALTFCLLFVSASILATGFIVTHADHDCAGEGCAVCAQIQSAQNLLNGDVALAFVSLAGAEVFAPARLLPPASFSVIAANPVSFKVKMNN
ncbi:MAG: hypothetical protein LBT26_00350 [Clostridiales Family XIII bacterium]|jgi:hypothetical protein|nr:hypothetical protein [Clostridiales Family XIII bacterium]